MTGIYIDEISTRDGLKRVSTATAIDSMAKAWVNFDGATGGIRASSGVAAVTRLSAGKYVITLNDYMTDTGACVMAFANNGDPHAEQTIGSVDAAMTDTRTIKVGVTGSASNVEPYWNNVALLLHGEGLPGKNAIRDSSPRSKAVVAASTGVTSTTKFKYGTSSIWMDGTVSGYVMSASTTEFDTLLNDYTIEMWVNLSTMRNCYLVTRYTSWAGAVHMALEVMATGAVRLRAGNATPISITSGNFLQANTWHHVAVSCASGTTKLFIDGAVEAVTTTTASLASTGVLYIGSDNGASGTTVHGYMDDIRFTNGVARYLSNFTPPVAACPDAAQSFVDATNVNVVVYR